MFPLHQRQTIGPHWGTERPNACPIATSSLKHKTCLARLLTLFCPHCCLGGTPHNVSQFRTGHWTTKPHGSYLGCCLATSLGSPTVPRGAWALVPCSPCPMWKHLSKCRWRGGRRFGITQLSQFVHLYTIQSHFVVYTVYCKYIHTENSKKKKYTSNIRMMHLINQKNKVWNVGHFIDLTIAAFCMYRKGRVYQTDTGWQNDLIKFRH